MKEFKCKLWSALSETMYSWEEIHGSRQAILQKDLKSDFYTVPNREAATMLWFSGIKDCEGVEIYLGDLYYPVSEPSMLFVVYFHEGAFCGREVGTPEENGQPLGWDEEGYFSEDYNWLKVVGNIYENPELLEGK